MSSLLLIFTLFIIIFANYYVSANDDCHSEVAIEHFFFDLQKTTHQFVFQLDDQFQSPVSLKLQCKGGGCPDVNGTKVMLSKVPHHSAELNDIPLFVEETSGWLLFYKDASWKEPLLLKDTVTPKEEKQGFVYFEAKKGTKQGGVLKYGCQ